MRDARTELGVETMAKGRGGARQPLSRVRPGKTSARVVKTKAKTDSKQAVKRKVIGRAASSVQRPKSRANRRASAPADELYSRLERAYPDAHCALDHRNAYELLAATILSAQ